MAPGAVEVAIPPSDVTFDTGVKCNAVAEVAAFPPTEAALEHAVNRFTARNPNSQALHELATASMPGGNTRTQLHTSPFPVCMKSGAGYQLTSEDSHVWALPPPTPLAGRD